MARSQQCSKDILHDSLHFFSNELRKNGRDKLQTYRKIITNSFDWGK